MATQVDPIFIRRCRQIMHPHAATLEPVQESARAHVGSLIWFENVHHQLEGNQNTDLGHGRSIIFQVHHEGILQRVHRGYPCFRYHQPSIIRRPRKLVVLNKESFPSENSHYADRQQKGFTVRTGSYLR